MTVADNELTSLFQTLLLTRRIETRDIDNDRIRDAILAREKRETGIILSNVGGWHSGDDIFDWGVPAIDALGEAFKEAGADMTSHTLPPNIRGKLQIEFYGNSWANVMRDGNYHRIHNHPGAVWSGVYYVATGQLMPGLRLNGEIEFQDPRPGNIHGGKWMVKPEAGTMLMFPAWLNHFVNPFHGSGERISIACNLSAAVVQSE